MTSIEEFKEEMAQFDAERQVLEDKKRHSPHHEFMDCVNEIAELQGVRNAVRLVRMKALIESGDAIELRDVSIHLASGRELRFLIKVDSLSLLRSMLGKSGEKQSFIIWTHNFFSRQAVWLLSDVIYSLVEHDDMFGRLYALIDGEVVWGYTSH